MKCESKRNQSTWSPAKTNGQLSGTGTGTVRGIIIMASSTAAAGDNIMRDMVQWGAREAGAGGAAEQTACK